MCEIITIPLFSVIFLFCSRFGTRERDSSKLVNNESIADKHRSSIACYGCIPFMSQLSSFYVTVGFLLFHGCNMNSG